MMSRSKSAIGSSFDDYLAQEGLLDSSTAVAIKRVIAWQLAEAMKAQGLSKTAMAQRMRTSRSLLDRLLDGSDPGLTLETLSRAATALGYRVRVELEAA
jgi:DNA-binding Xre family transcriptional regulator